MLSLSHVVLAWQSKYLFPPRYKKKERIRLLSADGVRLSAARLTGPLDAPATVVLVHGFANWSRTPAIENFARLLATEFHVIIPDMRGHGRSGGRCSMGLTEPIDVQTCVSAAMQGLPVITVGISLGAAATLQQAGTQRNVAGTVAISAPAWSRSSDGEGSVRVHQWIDSARMRILLAVFCRTRVDSRCTPVPDASKVVASISPAFTILVHDPKDEYFGPQHPRSLHNWASEPKELWWLDDAGHGVDVLGLEFGQRLIVALKEHLGRKSAVHRSV